MANRIAVAAGVFVAATALTGGAAWAVGGLGEESTTPAQAANASTANLDPLREEHKELIPHIEFLRTTADSVGTADEARLREDVEHAHEWLETGLLPHAQVEDQVLYGYVDKVIGKGGSDYAATDTMVEDHHRIGALTEELGTLEAGLADGMSDQEANDLRRVLYGLNTLVDLHFEKEEAVYLPALEAGLSATQGEQLIEEMEAASAEGGHGH